MSDWNAVSLIWIPVLGHARNCFGLDLAQLWLCCVVRLLETRKSNPDLDSFSLVGPTAIKDLIFYIARSGRIVNLARHALDIMTGLAVPADFSLGRPIPNHNGAADRSVLTGPSDRHGTGR